MMRNLFSFLGVLGLLMAAPTASFAQINIFACEPEWAALASEIGGDNVQVFSATTAQQDPHHIRARPSLMSAMRKAELVVCSGAGLEVGWLPLLLQKAGNANTQPGAPGYLMAADVVPILEKPQMVDRSMGHVHPEGNPHVHLNPHNTARVAHALLDRLQAIDAANAESYQSGYDEFSAQWAQAIVRWEQAASELRGVNAVVHHKSFSYLLDWLGMEAVASLEPTPGIPPTAAHLESLLQRLRTQPAQVILRTPYDAEDASHWISEKTAIPAIMLPYTVGGDDQSDTLIALFDRTIAMLREATHDQH